MSMSSFWKWSAALAQVESGDNPGVGLGDAGRAAGRWQMHPDFYQDWVGHITVGMSWDDAFRIALGRFYAVAVTAGVSDVDAAVGFHLHGRPDVGHAEDAPEYAQKFQDALSGLESVGQKKPTRLRQVKA